MDKGFYSAKNLEILLRKFKEYKFLMTVPFTTILARKIVSDGFDKFNNDEPINIGDDVLTSYSFINNFDIHNSLKYHVYYNEMSNTRKEKELTLNAIKLREKALKNPK
jgi:hypothetical protein